MIIERAAAILRRLVAVIRCWVFPRNLLRFEPLYIRASRRIGLVFRLNSIQQTCRVLTIFALILMATLVAGCAMPRYAMSLDAVLEQENKSNRTRYGYRCTRGAHRGASEKYRENTMAALKAADTNSAYAFIEFDVQYAKDRRIVVFHDKTMLRQFGNMRAVGNMTFAELSEISGGEIAAYDDVMDALGKKLNIEIKSQGDAYEDRCLVDEIVEDIRTRKRVRDVLISSISSDVITYVNRMYPEIATGQIFWLTSSTYLHFDRLTERLYEDTKATNADYLMLHVANLRNIDDLLKLKPKGKTVAFWDFDDALYLVHKDMSDRLWGDSGMKTFYQGVRYDLGTSFQRHKL